MIKKGDRDDNKERKMEERAKLRDANKPESSAQPSFIY